MTEISQRGSQLGTENAFVVLSEVEKLRALGNDVVSFCIGQPDFQTPAHVREAACSAIEAGHTGYTESAGIQELRRAVAAYVSASRGIRVSENDVVCGAGAKPFIGYSIQSVTDYGKGHEVIYPVPGFPIYQSQASHHGAVAVPLALRASQDFRYDLDELAARINENTRLLILNSPHNPTGAVFKKDYLEAIAEILQPWDKVWVLSDEPYSAFTYDEGFSSIASVRDMQQRTVIVDSVSKTYSMTGWRVGYGINKKLAPVFSRLVTNTTSCAAHPNQYAALTALEGPQDCVEEMLQVFRQRRDHIVAGLNQLEGIDCLLPAGAFYAWPDVSKLCEITGVADSSTLAQRLLHEAGVAVLADAHFGLPFEGEGQHLRLSYACSIEEIDSGLDRIRSFISKNNQEL